MSVAATNPLGGRPPADRQGGWTPAVAAPRSPARRSSPRRPSTGPAGAAPTQGAQAGDRNLAAGSARSCASGSACRCRPATRSRVRPLPPRSRSTPSRPPTTRNPAFTGCTADRGSSPPGRAACRSAAAPADGPPRRAARRRDPSARSARRPRRRSPWRNRMRILAGATTALRRIVDLGLVILILVVLLGVVLGKGAPLVGRQSIVIGGGSMEPTIGLGSAIIVRPVDPAGLAVGDVVSLRVGPEQTTYTHRIIALVERADGRWIRTQGDANAAPDPTLVPGQRRHRPGRARHPARGLPPGPAVAADGRDVRPRSRGDPPRDRLAPRVARARAATGPADGHRPSAVAADPCVGARSRSGRGRRGVGTGHRPRRADRGAPGRGRGEWHRPRAAPAGPALARRGGPLDRRSAGRQRVDRGPDDRRRSDRTARSGRRQATPGRPSASSSPAAARSATAAPAGCSAASGTR